MNYMRCTGDKRSAYRILVRKHKGKALLVRHRYRWEHDIKMVLKEIGWRNVDFVCVALGLGSSGRSF